MQRIGCAKPERVLVDEPGRRPEGSTPRYATPWPSIRHSTRRPLPPDQRHPRLHRRSMVGHDVAIAAALNHRRLRAQGVTVRRIIDLLIGTFCIPRGHALLHHDRHFDPMAARLGLQVV